MIPLILIIIMTSLAACTDKPGSVFIRPDNIVKKKVTSLQIYTNLSGFRNYVFYCDFSSDNKWLAAGSADRNVRVWSLPDFQLKYMITNSYPETWGLPVKFSSDNRYLVAGAYDQLKVFDVTRNFQLAGQSFAHNKGIQSIAIAPDSRTVLTAGVDGDIIAWKMPELEMVSMVKGHQSEVWNVHVSPDGRTCISGGEDKLFKIWSYPDLKLQKSVSFHMMPIEYVRYSSTGRQVLIASMDSTISIWNVGEWDKPYRVLKGPLGSVLVAIFSQDDQFVIAGGDDDVIYVINIEDSSIFSQKKEHYGDVMTLAVSQDWKWLASGSRDRSVRIWRWITE